MRLLITRFPYESQLSGEEWHSLTLSEELAKRGHHIYFGGSCEILLNEFKKRGFVSRKIWGGRSAVSKEALILFFFTAPFIFLNFLRVLVIMRRKYKIDTVYMHSLNEKLLMTPLALLLKMKVVWVEHARIGRWLTLNPYLFLYKLWARFVDIISVSGQTTKKLSWINSIHTITNGIDLTQFKPLTVDKSRFFGRNFKFLKNTHPVIGAVARLYPDKGLTYLIQGFSHLLKRHPDAKLAIVGIGPEEENLRTLVNTLKLQKKVAFLHEIPRPELLDFYNAIDVFVLPSAMHDPFGLVVAEAMACQKPVILTDVCGISESLHTGEDSIIVSARDSKAITEALRIVLENPRDAFALALKGYNVCRIKFSLTRMVDDYENILTNRS